MRPTLRRLLLVSVAALAAAACSRNPRPAAGAAAPYEELPDTVVCVVDRTSESGLRELEAKRDPSGGVLLMVDGEARPLDSVHPVTLVAGYGGRERWFAEGEAIAFRGQRFQKVETERRVPADLLGRVGEHQGVPLFADPRDDPPPEAVYVPIRPGCVFQAYVREDLMRGADEGR